MLIDFIFDTETRSRLDLKEVGQTRYMTDPSTEATRLTWCFGRTGVLKIWRLGEPIPADLQDVMSHPEKYRFVAWNIQFDYMVWICCFAKGYPRPPLENLEDAMALSTEYRTGASLESAAKFMNLPMGKDQEGRRIMLKQCKPDRTGNFPTLTEEENKHFDRYALLDTQILRDVYYRLPNLPGGERWAWEWTMRRNLRGVRLDVELINELDSIVKEYLPKLTAEFDYLVGYKCKMNSPVACKAFFKEYFPWIEDLRADTVRDMFASEDFQKAPPHIRRALEIKDLAGSTSIAKIECAVNQMYQGRIYGLFAYGYTQTKRWAGRSLQPQNFPRPDDSLADKIDFDLNVEDLVGVVKRRRSDGLKDPIGFVKNLLRRMFLPETGQHFYCGDFSKVEPSVLFWLTGLGPIPKKWYEEMASEIYGIPVPQISKDGVERQVGKAAALSCGYGTGWKGFQTSIYKSTGIRLSDHEAKNVIQAYRRKYAVVAQLWTDLEFAFRKAIQGQGTKLCDGKIFVLPMEHPWRGVKIRLPSGNHLYYHGAMETTEEFEEEIVTYEFGEAQKTKIKKVRSVLKYLSDQGQGRVSYDYVYGGLLCENVVSSTARDILVPAMWRLEQQGFDVLGVVHDEVWATATPGRDKEFTELMCKNPSWCSMDISSDLKVGVRYLK